MHLIYAVVPDGVGASVILNGVTVYHEENVRCMRHQDLYALDVANALAKALDTTINRVDLTWEDINPVLWTWEDAQRAAVKLCPSDEDVYAQLYDPNLEPPPPKKRQPPPPTILDFPATEPDDDEIPF